MHLFAYGTLMCDDIMAEISGSRLSHVAATLRGYRRMSVRDEHYPALVPDVAGCVQGVVYFDVPRSAWDRLDRFEGEMYSRENVTVERDDGSAVPAAAYVARAEIMACLVDVEWDFADFLRTDKESFRRSYKGYRELE